MSKTNEKTNSNNMEQLKNRLGSKAKKVQEETEKENINSELILQHISFDFEADSDTLNYLKDQTYKIHLTMSKSYTDLGKIFKETQTKLAGSNQHDGLFYKWFRALDFTNDFVYKLINRNDLLVRFSDKQNLIEALPITLSYEISKPNCPEDLRNAVLNGEIKTLKEFNQAASNLLPLTPQEIVIPENLNEIFERDIKVFSKNYATINEVLKEKLENLSDSSKKSILDEIEFLNKKMEKLINKL